ncbi:nickel-responsive transcriptional regulator NikR [Candidatus Caldatribacterium sp. SIUC1]|uniref:nickel-responsive transcriptional regulator NikR n=1 Tax=Candidatus Caldatribacterium sp. SIUC1 TaxID=3418365 RepID=UPI003F6913C2
MALVRFGVSMDHTLLEVFDRTIQREGFASRSDALRHLVQRFISAKRWEHLAGQAMGAVTLVYDHTTRNLTERLLKLEHAFRDTIVSTTHVHCNARVCLEVLLVRGETKRIATLVRELQSLRGVLDCQVTSVPFQENEGEESHG